MAKVIVAVAGDLHVNSTTALCPPYFDLDDGGSHRASKLQLWIWNHWVDYWKEIKHLKERKRWPVVVVLNGELADDLSHRSTQLITRNPSDQLRLSIAALEPMLDVVDHLYVTRGTEAHSGLSASLDETVARDLGAIPDEEEHYARWLLRTEIAGTKFHVAHHPGMGHSRAWTKGGDANRIALGIVIRYADQGLPPPDIAVFGHTHKDVDSGRNFKTHVEVFPSWQLSNAFGHRLGGDWLKIGAGYFICKKGTQPEIHTRFRRPPVPEWTTLKL